LNTIRFNTREAFIEALEGRRKFWRDYDKRSEREHKAAEQKFLTDARAKMRAALKMDYEALCKEAQYGSLSLGERPRCPALMEPKIDKVLAALKHTQGKGFTVGTTGVWSEAHNLLTWDPDARLTVC